MAVANTKSTAISNADAQPRVANSPHLEKSPLIESVATVEIAAADDDNSVLRLFRVPSNARISQLLFANDTLTGATSFDVGIYQTAANGGAVADSDLFLSAVDFSTARAQFADLSHESASNNIADCEKRIWELLALTADPHRDYDICITALTIGSGAGTVSAICRYTK